MGGLDGGLSPAARSVWAKYDFAGEGWLPLWRHLLDSAAVAGLLWDEWVPRSVRALVGEVLPDGAADARLLVVWLAGVHDIGKATPAFACQVDALAGRMRDAGLEMAGPRGMADRRMAPHGLAGQMLLARWLEERWGWSPRACGQFAVVVGGHHGLPPESVQVKDLDDHPELLCTPGRSEAVWRGVQEELLDACALEFGVAGRLAAWQGVKLPQPAQVMLSALVIVADWIASNADLFPYFPEAASRSGAERVAAAWRELDLPAPWRPGEFTGSACDLFATRFDLPPGARPRPVQEAAVRLARDLSVPGLMMIEAPMGEGKTEAALAVAEIFAGRSGAGGVFFALPTMATSNGMFPRLLDWLGRMPPGADGVVWSVRLAHSKAALNEHFADLMAASQSVGAVDVDGEAAVVPLRSQDRPFAPAELVAHQWLSGRKKAMLSSFVVGTIDQLLFAGLKSRHLALRHLALAGKVVVIDEAHAYDAYMTSYLDRVLSWLGEYRVPVVVLSATLPAGRRRALAEAYAGKAAVDGHAGLFAGLARAEDYPLLTAVMPGGAPVVERPGVSGRGGVVEMEWLVEGLDALGGRLSELVAGGGCVLVVRNTVARVQETAEALRARFGAGAVSVAHARFMDPDRAAKDAWLLRKFGPPGREGLHGCSGVSGSGRPGLHFVVASQVAEQSLDIDFDLLVTDLAPVDLVLQRMGRLHRHVRPGRPAPLSAARCIVTGLDWSRPVPRPVAGSVRVYGRHALLRSLAVLLPHLQGGAGPVRLPEDISPLVQQAYGPGPVGPGEWAEVMQEAQRVHEDELADKERRADTYRLAPALRPGRALTGWVKGGAGDVDDSRGGRAQVRDSKETLEVLVVQRQADGTVTTPSWLGPGEGGLALPVHAVPELRAARVAASCGLRLPLQFSQPYVIDKVIAELEEFCPQAWQSKECHWLAGELFLVLGPDCQTRLAGFRLKYSSSEGLEVTREQ
ncbi:CRISPR-associated helicase Cas3' [Streptomyces sp. SID1034]|uniref:CRISPR-associated helicase Cas3' n=1 Tax=Streptomyces sp. SID1034 TaxID=2690248 RepID=UPI00136D53AA|nr:CRISPR-associated helicase Cas3' [Streptomyces sp. SID1034]